MTKNLFCIVVFLVLGCEEVDSTYFQDQSNISGTVAIRHKCHSAIDIDTQEEVWEYREKNIACIQGDLTIIGTDIRSIRLERLQKIYGRLVIVNNQILEDTSFPKLRYIRDGLIIIDNHLFCDEDFVYKVISASEGYSLEPLPNGYFIGWNGVCLLNKEGLR